MRGSNEKIIARQSAFDKRLGALLKKIRTDKGISQTTVGEACGVTFQQMQKYERGENRISASTLVDIAAALHETPASIFNQLATAAPKR